MKKLMKNKTICLAIAALALAGSLTVGSTLAYFTAFDTAAGAVPLELGFTETVPNETVENQAKTITIENKGNYDCYVRLKALTGDKYAGCLKYAGTNWSEGEDGYWYYSEILTPGASTEAIVVDISEAFAKADTDFNVIIVQECTPVLYDAEEQPYADWNVVADIAAPETVVE